jgi:hypothetical protein
MVHSYTRIHESIVFSFSCCGFAAYCAHIRVYVCTIRGFPTRTHAYMHLSFFFFLLSITNWRTPQSWEGHSESECQHMSAYVTAYVSIRQHTSAYVSIRLPQELAHTLELGGPFRMPTILIISILLKSCQHTSAHVSTRQDTSACVSIRQHTSAHVSMRQHASAYVSIHRHSECQRTTILIISILLESCHKSMN